MIRRCVCMIAAMASFSVNGAFGQAPTGASLGNVADQPSQKAEQQLAAAKNPDPRQPPPGGNPLWETPMSALSVTRDRRIGKPHNVALFLNQTTRTLVRLHVGEEAAGWYLRSVDARTMTLEKDSQQVTLSLPVPSAALPANPQPVPARIAGLKAL